MKKSQIIPGCITLITLYWTPYPQQILDVGDNFYITLIYFKSGLPSTHLDGRMYQKHFSAFKVPLETSNESCHDDTLTWNIYNTICFGVYLVSAIQIRSVSFTNITFARAYEYNYVSDAIITV